MARHRRQPGGGEDAIDHVPQRPRLPLRDEIGFARDRRPGGKPIRGQQVCVGRVVDVDGIDEVGPRPMRRSRPARARAMIAGPGGVARSPDQMRPQRHRRQVWAVRLASTIRSAIAFVCG